MVSIRRSSRARERWADPYRRAHLLAAQINAAERRRLRKLVEDNTRLAPFFARWWARRNPQLDHDDLSQAAMLGLIRAAEKWDPRRGAFTTCAWLYMRIAVQREVELTRATIRVPLGAHGPRTRSLDAPIGDTTLGELVTDHSTEDPSVELDREFLREHVAEALATLRPRDAQIVELRFGINGAGRPHTLQEIGARLGVTRERIRQLEAHALNALRFRLRLLDE